MKFKAGISIWNDRVSPVMDTSVSVALYDIKDGAAVQTGTIEMEGMTQNEKVEALRRAGVDLLVCGAVSNQFMRSFRQAGIELIPWVSGECDVVLKALSRGYLDPTELLMPGCQRRRCRRNGSQGTGAGIGMGQGRSEGDDNSGHGKRSR